jgi:hypothetical protein
VAHAVVNGTQIDIKLADNPVFGDFNEDGLLDVAVYETEEIGPGIRMAVFRGNRTFTALKENYSLPCSTIATADVNNDGHLDISTAPVRCF